jgi:hypothetical protein
VRFVAIRQAAQIRDAPSVRTNRASTLESSQPSEKTISS